MIYRAQLVTAKMNATATTKSLAWLRPLWKAKIGSVHTPRQVFYVDRARGLSTATSALADQEDEEISWRRWVSRESGSEFPAEAGRYHLFVAYPCPFAHRTLLARSLKGLKEAVSVTFVHPIWQKTRPDFDDHHGWHFADPESTETLTNSAGRGGPFPLAYPGTGADPFLGHKTIRDYYEHVGDTVGPRSVPILWDKKANTIVNNESSEILRMLNSEFNEFSNNPDLDLYPEDLRQEIDKVNSWVNPNLASAVYRAGNAKTQEVYDSAMCDITEAFDRVDGILQKQRYIAGDRFTEADIRLFVMLLRFDEVYAVYFKTNTRSVLSTPSILNYCREIYQMPGVKETVDMEQIKVFYYASTPNLNHYSIIPRGPDTVRHLEEPHNRGEMFLNESTA